MPKKTAAETKLELKTKRLARTHSRLHEDLSLLQESINAIDDPQVLRRIAQNLEVAVADVFNFEERRGR
jgi:hypothetical protein